eukprot:COSAG02_NODE_633_length_19262_cov_32.473256_18_plen_63_part_00
MHLVLVARMLVNLVVRSSLAVLTTGIRLLCPVSTRGDTCAYKPKSYHYDNDDDSQNFLGRER